MEIVIGESGVDWPAWVQAIGSVLAIIFAVIIDQGAARRLKRDRANERAEAISARVAMLRKAQAALAEAAEAARTLDHQHQVNPQMPDKIRRRVLALNEAVLVLLAQRFELPPGLLFALTEAEKVLSQSVAMPQWRLPHDVPSAQTFMVQLHRQSEEVCAIIAEWEVNDLI